MDADSGSSIPEHGVWIGVDVGSVRVGVARSDALGMLASPVATLTADDAGFDALVALVDELDAVGVVLGLPRTLKGHEGPSAQLARAYGDRLADRIAPTPVHYVDERLTTVSAQRKLHETGLRGSRRTRAVIDQAAAVELLQHWLDITRRG